MARHLLIPMGQDVSRGLSEMSGLCGHSFHTSLTKLKLHSVHPSDRIYLMARHDIARGPSSANTHGTGCISRPVRNELTLWSFFPHFPNQVEAPLCTPWLSRARTWGPTSWRATPSSTCRVYASLGDSKMRLTWGLSLSVPSLSRTRR